MRMSTKVRRFIRIILSHVPHWGGPRIIPARSSSVVAPQRKLEGAIRPGKLQTDVPLTQRSGDASVLPLPRCADSYGRLPCWIIEGTFLMSILQSVARRSVFEPLRHVSLA